MFLQYFIRVSTSLNVHIQNSVKRKKKNLVRSESFIYFFICSLFIYLFFEQKSFIKFMISIIYWKFQRLCLRLSDKGKGTWKL